MVLYSVPVEGILSLWKEGERAEGPMHLWILRSRAPRQLEAWELPPLRLWRPSGPRERSEQGRQEPILPAVACAAHRFSGSIPGLSVASSHLQWKGLWLGEENGSR